MEILSKNTEENKRIAELILQNLQKKEVKLLFLKGKLGSGKTTITREIGQVLNTKNNISSPTFVIQKIYHCNKNKYNISKIYHIDLYRLTKKQDIEELDLFEDLQNKKNLFIVEWPELIEKEFKNPCRVKIETNGQNQRVFSIS